MDCLKYGSIFDARCKGRCQLALMWLNTLYATYSSLKIITITSLHSAMHFIVSLDYKQSTLFD